MDEKYLQKNCFNCREYQEYKFNKYKCRLGKWVNIEYPYPCKNFSNRYFMTKEMTEKYKGGIHE